MVGSVQAGSSGLVAMAAKVVTGTVVYAAAQGIASLSFPVGNGAASGVVVIEAVLRLAGTLGAKEMFVHEVVLLKTA